MVNELNSTYSDQQDIFSSAALSTTKEGFKKWINGNLTLAKLSSKQRRVLNTSTIDTCSWKP
jgi:hypothetical protein